jgi:sulfatase maturation enzyme AslB (radical SAM superfamily)
VPGTALCESAQQSLEAFRLRRAEIIAESVRLGLLGGSDDERKFSAGCAECANFVEGDYGNFDGLIHYVNLSCYPAPCQCKCIYCDVHCGESGRFNRQLHADYYEKLFDTLEYARETGQIASNARWQVSSGEIAIHPYKDRIFELVKDQATTFYTNCFLFEEGVAANLAANPHSAINLSIDARTPKPGIRSKALTILKRLRPIWQSISIAAQDRANRSS